MQTIYRRNNIVTGFKGIGGLQTRGKCREGYPKSLYTL